MLTSYLQVPKIRGGSGNLQTTSFIDFLFPLCRRIYHSRQFVRDFFSNFFVDKVAIIRSEFPGGSTLRGVHPIRDIIFLMSALTLEAEADIGKLIMKSKSTSADLGPFSTGLLGIVVSAS